MQSLLPTETGLPVRYLAAAFDNVTNSYKYLWFLAILDEVENGADRSLPVARLLGRMIATAWYPVNYFRISFGKQDLLARLVTELMVQEKAPLHARGTQVTEIATEEIASASQLGKELSTLGDYVPYRFIRPFFAERLRGTSDAQVNRKIGELAQAGYADPRAPCIYRVGTGSEKAIELHPVWVEYLRRHIAILRGYTLWHLLNYLQQRNPGMSNLATKLFEPKTRNLSQARQFWNIAFERLHSINCIYSGELMYGNEYSLDHFLPWRFVAHDSLWNIVPTTRRVNSAKGDRLPDFATYFDRLAQVQFNAMQAVISTRKHNQLLEDYLFLLDSDSTAAIGALTIEQLHRALHSTIAPQVQIAINLGFEGGWSY